MHMRTWFCRTAVNVLSSSRPISLAASCTTAATRFPICFAGSTGKVSLPTASPPADGPSVAPAVKSSAKYSKTDARQCFDSGAIRRRSGGNVLRHTCPRCCTMPVALLTRTGAVEPVENSDANVLY
eukprot:354314-Chlamydomonas_euryale.AAC.1